jgi:putative hydrolase of the HAD superfamily
VASAPAACVVLDLDDTLFLERDYVRSGFQAVGRWTQRELGLARFAERAWTAFEAGARGDVFDRVLRECGCAPTPALVQRLVELYRGHAPHIALLPDGRLPLACVTDGPLPSQRAKAQALGLERWASPLVFTAQWGAGFGKPHPRAFEQVQHTLAVRPDACVYVADNPAKDFAGPRALGWRTVRVRREGGLHAARPSGADVDHEVAELTSLPAWLGRRAR